MSSKVYFRDSNRSFVNYFIRLISSAYHAIHPSGAERYVRKILTQPEKRAPVAIPDDITAQSVATPYGELETYSIGKGPTVLFIHGWSGSGSQFFNLMRTVANQGYRAVTYDHYKHGHSEGKECNYPLFIHSLDILSGYLFNVDKLRCVVSHSMGASAALDFFKHKSTPHFLIAPLFNFYEELETRVKSIGIPEKLFDKIVSAVEQDYNIAVKSHDSIRDIKTITAPIAIIHSKNDKFAAYELSQYLAEKHDNILLHSVDDIGHMRIVATAETQSALTLFLAKLSAKEPLPS